MCINFYCSTILCIKKYFLGLQTAQPTDLPAEGAREAQGSKKGESIKKPLTFFASG
jgi:hypothetical protein